MASHVSLVVFVYLELGGWGVVGCVVVGRIRLFGQEVGHQVVQCPSTQPVSTESECIVSFQSGDPPCSSGGDLLAEIGVLVDVDLAIGKTMVLQERCECGVCVLEIIVPVIR